MHAKLLKSYSSTMFSFAIDKCAMNSAVNEHFPRAGLGLITCPYVFFVKKTISKTKVTSSVRHPVSVA